MTGHEAIQLKNLKFTTESCKILAFTQFYIKKPLKL